MVSFYNWVSSNYACDEVIGGDLTLAPEMLRNAKETSRKIGLLDIPSQLIKMALEILLWPVATLGGLGYSVINISFKFFQDTLRTQDFIMGPVASLLYPPVSVANRIRLIGIDLFGIINPEFAAKERHDAFETFLEGKSLLETAISLVRNASREVISYMEKKPSAKPVISFNQQDTASGNSASSDSDDYSSSSDDD